MRTFDFERPSNQYGDISVDTALQGKMQEHREIERQIQEFTAAGNQIAVLPVGASGTSNGVYGSIAKHLNKVQKKKAAQLAAKLYDDSSDEEQE